MPGAARGPQVGCQKPGNQGVACLAEKNECNNTDKRKGQSQALPSMEPATEEVPTRDPR